MTRGRKPMPTTNPFGLTPVLAESLDLVIEHRGTKAAAHATGIPLKTLETNLCRARAQMGAPYGDRLGYLFDWLEWRLGEGKGA